MELDRYDKLKKIGYIYKIQHKIKTHKFYVGLTELPHINDRFQDHKDTALQSLKLQLYKDIFRCGLKNYEIIQLEEVQYVDFQHLKDREDYWIKHLKSPLNNGFQFDCPCGSHYKQYASAKKHKKMCHIYKIHKCAQKECT